MCPASNSGKLCYLFRSQSLLSSAFSHTSRSTLQILCRSFALSKSAHINQAIRIRRSGKKCDRDARFSQHNDDEARDERIGKNAWSLALICHFKCSNLTFSFHAKLLGISCLVIGRTPSRSPTKSLEPRKRLAELYPSQRTCYGLDTELVA